MLARIRSAAVLGIDAYPVDVEVDISSGLPSFSTVGLPHGAVREGRERVSAALANVGYVFPLKRITVNLAPADIRKNGSGLDLPIAVGLLAASGQLEHHGLDALLIVGEVGLEGDLRPVRGALSMALAARAAGCQEMLVPTTTCPRPRSSRVSRSGVPGPWPTCALISPANGRSPPHGPMWAG